MVFPCTRSSATILCETHTALELFLSPATAVLFHSNFFFFFIFILFSYFFLYLFVFSTGGINEAKDEKSWMLAGKRKKNSLNCLKQCEKPIGLNGTRQKSADEQKQSKKMYIRKKYEKEKRFMYAICNVFSFCFYAHWSGVGLGYNSILPISHFN